MLKLLLFSKSALESGRGGEISLMELAKGLKDTYKITLLDTNRMVGKQVFSQKDIKRKIGNLKNYKRIRMATLTLMNKTFDILYPGNIIKLFKLMKNNDIIYSSSGNIKINIFFALYALLNPRAIFIIGHRKPFFSKKIISVYNIRIMASLLLFKLFKKNFYHHTISFHAKKYLENFYNPDKITHIIHGIELESFKDNLIKKSDPNRLKFIYVGNLDDYAKGVGVLLKAIEEVVSENLNLKISFEFCGIGPLEAEVRVLEAKYPSFIKYNGYISNVQISEFYFRNDVFFSTSRREPFGRVIIEALASKLIIICTKTIGSIEILKGKDFGFFLKKLKPVQIKEKILEIYDLWVKTPDLIKKLQEAAKNYAFQNYSFSRELIMFKNLFERVGKLND